MYYSSILCYAKRTVGEKNIFKKQIICYSCIKKEVSQYN